MGKIIEFKKPNTKNKDTKGNMQRPIEHKLERIKDNIEFNDMDLDNLCILAEELCRYKKIEILEKLLDEHNEILYTMECDILDIAVGTCNEKLLSMILSKFDKDYIPKIKYECSCHRAIENKREDILKLLKEHNVYII